MAREAANSLAAKASDAHVSCLTFTSGEETFLSSPLVYFSCHAAVSFISRGFFDNMTLVWHSFLFFCWFLLFLCCLLISEVSEKNKTIWVNSLEKAGGVCYYEIDAKTIASNLFMINNPLWSCWPAPVEGMVRDQLDCISVFPVVKASFSPLACSVLVGFYSK